MFILDKFSLFHLAKAIKARQNVINNSGSDDDANLAFESELFMKYSPEITIEVLETNPNLLDLLIELLTEEINLGTEIGNLSKRDELWARYEFLRRMTCFDEIGLIIIK